MNKIGVIGAGAFGTALANVLGKSGNVVLLFDTNKAVIDDINKNHKNSAHWPDLLLSKKIKAVSNLNELAELNTLLIAVPSFAFKSVVESLESIRWHGNLLICTKGIDVKSENFLSFIAGKDLFPSEIAVLSGPSFAKEVAEGKFSLFTFAGSEKFFKLLKNFIKDDNFALTRTDDLIGVQFAGTFKNIIALAMGILAGKKEGENAKAAFFTLAFSEMIRIGKALGAKTETFNMSAGIGDLVLTATSETSRNFKCGLNLASSNKNFSKEILCEGIEAFPVVEKMARKKRIQSKVLDFLKPYIH